MSDQLSRTRYRIGQRWAFQTTQEHVEKSLLILGVEEHPKFGFYCSISIRYDPPLRSGNNGFVTRTEYNITCEALDQSVTELLDEKATLPCDIAGKKEFEIAPEEWAKINLERVCVWTQAVDAELIWSNQQRRDSEAELLDLEEDESREMELAIENGDLECVRRLADANPELIHLPLGGEESCSVDQLLNYAAWQGKADIARFLIDRGADLNWRGNNGFTPLHYAARYNNPEVARLLIDAGADLESTDDLGFTPLLTAARSGELGEGTVAELLEDRGAAIDLNTGICLRKTEWVREYLQTHPDAVREAKFPGYLLEDMVISIQCKIWDEAGFSNPATAIVAKIMAENIPIMQTLIQQGADPNIGSALHTAIQIEDTATAELLLQSGADPNRDVKRSTFLPSVAKTDAMRQLLKRHGAQEDPQGTRDFVQEMMEEFRQNRKMSE